MRLAGDIAFVSQSGALVTAVLDWARSRRIGFSHMVSLGERADVDFGDLLDYLASDVHTRSILLYMESAEAPAQVHVGCPGRCAQQAGHRREGRAGRQRACRPPRRTRGRWRGPTCVIDAAIRRAGMLRVDTLQDLFMAARDAGLHFRGNPHSAPSR